MLENRTLEGDTRITPARSRGMTLYYPLLAGSDTGAVLKHVVGPPRHRSFPLTRTTRRTHSRPTHEPHSTPGQIPARLPA